jgi:hypothetical protein
MAIRIFYDNVEFNGHPPSSRLMFLFYAILPLLALIAYIVFFPCAIINYSDPDGSCSCDVGFVILMIVMKFCWR